MKTISSTGQRGVSDAMCTAVERFLAAKIADPEVKTKPYPIKASALNKRLTKVAMAAGYEGVSHMMKDVTAPKMVGCAEQNKKINARTQFNHTDNRRKTSATAKPLEFVTDVTAPVKQEDLFTQADAVSAELVGIESTPEAPPSPYMVAMPLEAWQAQQEELKILRELYAKD